MPQSSTKVHVRSTHEGARAELGRRRCLPPNSRRRLLSKLSVGAEVCRRWLGQGRNPAHATVASLHVRPWGPRSSIKRDLLLAADALLSQKSSRGEGPDEGHRSFGRGRRRPSQSTIEVGVDCRTMSMSDGALQLSMAIGDAEGRRSWCRRPCPGRG